MRRRERFCGRCRSWHAVDEGCEFKFKMDAVTGGSRIVGVTDLAAWLLLQIAEDERVARGIPEQQRAWNHDVPVDHDVPAALDLGGHGGSFVPVEGPHVAAEETSLCPAEAAHIAAWDPRRVLAECDTKRRLVEFWSRAYQNPQDADTFAGPDWDRVRDNAQWTLRRLALPYSDRPGYLEEWRP